MLKNKFGMTKVLVIVLSVLMLVSLVACNKADGPSTDDMNAAIQAAIDAANAEQAAKEAALAASIAADKAAQEAKDAAVAESLAKEKAENDAALKKAQEEAAAAKKAADEAAKKAADEAAAAKKAADEAAKKAAEEVAAAKKAAEQAADAAAKKAAEEAAAKAQEEAAAAIKAAEEAAAKAQSEAAAALKAAEEAAAKAQAEADRVAAELAAELAAAKAAAEKAAEEAAKAQAEASKAKEEAEKAKEEAANVSSKLDETTVVPPVETTVAPETTTAAPETTTAAPETTTAAPETTVAPETTTEAPVVPVDKTDVYVAYSKLKTEYTYTNQSLYNAAEYAELIMLFDKASLDLNNAATVEAATAVLETLKVDAAAVRNVKIAAAEVAALVNALGDIETEVFTTQAEKITEAQKAYTALKKEYASYFGYKADTKQDNQNGKDTVKIANKLGINVADLNKAAAKVVVLKGYIEDALYEDMATLYGFEDSTYAKLSAFDAEEVYATATKEGATAAEKATYNLIKDAYYKYLVLSVVNYGDFGKGVEIDWEMKKDENGNKVIDTEKPIEWFTTEQLLDTFILPTLDVEFADYLGGLLSTFETGMTDLVATLNAANNIVDLAAKDVDTDDVYDALEAKFEAMSFVNDYKADKTLDDAKVDANIIAIKAYIEAMNAYLDVAKETAIEAKKESTEALIQIENDKIDDAQDDMTDASATTIARLEGNIAKYKANIESLEAKEASYIANVEAAALLTFEEMLNADLNETTAYKNQWADITDFVKYTDTQIETFLNLVLANTINTNFADEITDTPDDPMLIDVETLRANVVDDLVNLSMMVSPYADEWVAGTTDGSIFNALKTTYGKYDVDAEGETLEGQVKNTQFFLDAIAALNVAIEGIEAVSAENYEPKLANLTYTKDDGTVKTYYFKNATTYNYAVANYEYDPADFDSIEKVMADTGLYQDSSTSYPIQFVITPAEQAMEEIATLYVDAFEAFSKTIAKQANGNYARDAKREIIYDKDHKTAFDRVRLAASGPLQTEMNNVANEFTSAIDALVSNYKMNFVDDGNDETDRNDNANIPTVDKIYRVASNWTDAQNGDAYTENGNKFVITSTFAGYSEYYDYDEYKNAILEVIEDFYAKVFNRTVDVTSFASFDATANYGTDDVTALWNAKLAAVAEINAALEDYKNTYNTDDTTGITTVTKNAFYTYGVAGAAAQPANVATYEAALDALFAEVIDEIMAIEIRDGATTIKNGKGDKVTANGVKFDGKDTSKIDYNLDNALAAIQAWENALLGTTGTYAHANNAAQDYDTNHFDKGNSKIFQEYNSIILGNTYGISYTCTHAIPTEE